MRIFIHFACLSLVQLTACSAHTRPIERITSDEIAQLGPYSHAVAAGELVFISGMIAHNKESGFAPAEIESQTRQVFSNLSSALDASGVTLSDVIKVTVYLKSPDDMKSMNDVYQEYFPNDLPARTTVPGANWGRDDILIEIDVIAVRQQK
jgi:2-iminobutanoate/2-iminopropanoate deaminase